MHEKVCKILNHITYFSFQSYEICFNFCSCFFSWCSTSSEITIKISVIATRIKSYKSRIKKKKKKHDKIVLLAKTKLNTIEVLISKALIEVNISRDEFVSVNNVLI